MSLPFTARDAANWTRGSLLQGSPEARFAGASIDSRAITPGELFVAIVGPNHDAHRFLSQVASAGAAGLLIERGRELPEGLAPDLAVIAVDDTTRGLGALAKGHRAEFAGPVVAITGSNGKTTTKEMCAAILSVTTPCLKNTGNLNNQFGLPVTLLRRSGSDGSVVVELGMNHRGEIAELVDIARPTVGVITNVGTAHIEQLGSSEEIALEKGDLIAGLPPDATAVLNADDPRVAAQAGRTPARILFFGSDSEADVRVENATPIDGRVGHGWKFDLATPSGCVSVEIAGLGETAWKNALAAAAGALAAGAPLDHVAIGLARHQPVAGRLAHVELPGGGVLIDDTYNANPQSMEVAMRLLAEISERGRSFAVVGDMGELGDTARAAHHATGRLAADLGIDFLFALGERAGDVAAGAREGGMAPERVRVGRDCEGVAAQVNEMLGNGDHVLVKGSRAMKMERVVEFLAAQRHSAEERD
jgi:UDP-N-acetylmuramoyl-tripeptide--D-alanyl-D-alanine ligase